VLDRGAQADARGATHLLGRGVQAFARGAARCALHVNGRGAKTDACGRSFAVLSTQNSTVSWRLRLVVPIPMSAAVASRCCRRRFQQLDCACGTLGWLVAAFKVSRDAAAAGEEQLVSCAAERSIYCFICTVTLEPFGDLTFMSWGRWQFLCGGADVGLSNCYAVSGCGT
jgi:hypothetical protein